MDTPYEKLLVSLAKADIRFIVVGGLAVALNGFVRTTEDVDILVDSAPDTSTPSFARSAHSEPVTPANSHLRISTKAKARFVLSKTSRSIFSR